MANEDVYYLALGRFVHNFSRVERCLHMTFRDFSKIDSSIAAAIKKESSSGALVSMIKAVAAINCEPDIVKELNICFAQFEHISEFRHRVIHRGASLQADGRYLANNIATMRNRESMETTTFELNDIQAATVDLTTITLRIFEASDKVNGILVSTLEPEILADLREPWLYKPVRLEMPHKAPSPKKPKPSRPPRSSPA